MTETGPLYGAVPVKVGAPFWRPLISRALRLAATPFYLLSAEPVREALADLSVLETSAPVRVRHWLSCKTQPVRQLLQWWRKQGRGVEVVSEFELLAALEEGFAPDSIVVNGPAKHAWLHRQMIRRLRVNIDSSSELPVLLPLARELDWSLGLRLQTREEISLATNKLPAQFGMVGSEAVPLIRTLLRARVRLEMLHFHIRTQVESAAVFKRAMEEVAGVCQAARFRPKYLDCGGGFPVPAVFSLDGRPLNRSFDLAEMACLCADVQHRLPGLEELWFENGRFVTARAGVLVIRVLDVKDRGSVRHLICDGGRTNHALISQWEKHALFSVPHRRGAARLTSVCGPTCMAFDQLALSMLPGDVQTGDYLVWMGAGAYHIPWETSFSRGRATVFWHEDNKLAIVRAAENFEQWWAQWRDGSENLAITRDGGRGMLGGERE